MLVISFLPAFIASASTILGNPTSNVTVDDGEDVHIHSILADRCAGGLDKVTPQVTLDKGESTAFTLSSVVYCELSVEVSWVVDGPVYELSVSNLDELDIDATGGNWRIDLSEANGTAVFITY